MKEIADNSYQFYISNLALNLVPNVDLALIEANRILKKGGKVAFSVIGKRENSTCFTLWQDVVKKYTPQIPDAKPERGLHYLANKDELIKLLEKHNFKVSFCWIETINFPWEADDEIKTYLDVVAEPIKKFDSETQVKIREEIIEEFKKLKENHSPLQKEAYLIVGTKL